MDEPNFTYNKIEASCHYCSRTKNPHPDFDEPLVTTKIKIKTRNIEICINCWHELDGLAKGSKKSFKKTVSEKEELLQLLSKSAVL